MKFNRKVYVVPEEKYLSMVRDLKRREEVVGGDPQLPPTQVSESEGGTKSSLHDGLSEMTGGPETHPPGSVGSAGVDKSSGEENVGQADAISASLTSDRNKKNLRKVRALLAPYKGGKNGRKNFTASLLHTQSSRFPLPEHYKTFYTVLLEKNVPLDLIGNKRLRRVLQYLKNLKRGEEGVENKKKKEKRGDIKPLVGHPNVGLNGGGKKVNRRVSTKTKTKGTERGEVTRKTLRTRGKVLSKTAAPWVKL